MRSQKDINRQESKENAGFIDRIDCVNSHLIVSVLENTFGSKEDNNTLTR